MIKLIRVSLIIIFMAIVASACSTAKIADYANEKPELSLRDYFNGEVEAWGQVQDRSGKVIKRFTVSLVGVWQGQEGVLTEDFVYSDGTKQQRIWRLKDLGEGRYEGRADDVVGVAQGITEGNALQWRYTLKLPVDGKTYHVAFNDWMYLHDEQTLVNRAEMSKFGIHLADITLFFRKVSP
jgi:hypothetical protein